MFDTGWKGYEEHKKEALIDAPDRLYDFWLQADDSRLVKFLTYEPVLFFRHTVKWVDKYRSFICLADKNCSLCKQGEVKQYVGAFLVYEKACKTKDGKELKGNIKLYTVGKSVLELLQKLPDNAEIENIGVGDIKISRTGQGKSSLYQFFPKKGELSNEDTEKIKAVLQTDKITSQIAMDYLVAYLKKALENQKTSGVLDKIKDENAVEEDSFEEEVAKIPF